MVRRAAIGINEVGVHGSAIVGNRVLRSGVIGISLANGGQVLSTGNQLVNNLVRRSDGDGILVEPLVVTTTVERNMAFENGDDGIDVDSPDTAITRNRADRNGDLGIEAVEGVTDGGGNRARRNGNRSQCTGVTCR